jgi:hypothetical protein
MERKHSFGAFTVMLLSALAVLLLTSCDGDGQDTQEPGFVRTHPLIGWPEQRPDAGEGEHRGGLIRIRCEQIQ